MNFWPDGPTLFKESTNDELYRPQFQAEKHSVGGLLSFRVIIPSSLPGIVLVYACGTGLIIDSAVFCWQKCSGLNDK